MNKNVWYASYGSNMNKNRFMYYIYGGHFNHKFFKGSSKKIPPLQETTMIINYEIYFAKKSSLWNNKGVCFIHNEFNKNFKTLCKLYLINKDQFSDIHKQEGEWYNLIINLGELQGYEIFTFTNENELEINAPSFDYLKVIIKGIKNSFKNYTNEDIYDYLISIKGINNEIDEDDLLKLVNNN